MYFFLFFFFSSRRRHTRCSRDWSSDVCSSDLPAQSLFVLIGALPYTDWLGDTVLRDEHGFILSGPDLVRDGSLPPAWPLARAPYLFETSVPGVFVAGDARHGSIKRVASGVGEGTIAEKMIERYLEEV